MPIYNYLPGVIVNYLDGGLTSTAAPQDDSILIIGTAGQGPVNTPYQVTDRAVAASTFGFSGSLERSIEECATNSDNIIAFRMGATPMVRAGVGDDTTVGSPTPGFTIIFNGDVSITAPTDYQIWYKAGVLSVWNAGTLVYNQVPSSRRNISVHARAKEPLPQHRPQAAHPLASQAIRSAGFVSMRSRLYTAPASPSPEAQP